MSHPSSASLGRERHKPLYFSSWFLVDQKRDALFMLCVAVGIGICVWQRYGTAVYGLIALFVLLVSAWRLFVPIHFEINSDGIIHGALGRKRFISWEDVRVYRIRRRGILLLPQRDRFFLEAFRGFYLPVPPSLMTDVLYRFRVYVDKIQD